CGPRGPSAAESAGAARAIGRFAGSAGRGLTQGSGGARQVTAAALVTGHGAFVIEVTLVGVARPTPPRRLQAGCLARVTPWWSAASVSLRPRGPSHLLLWRIDDVRGGEPRS